MNINHSDIYGTVERTNQQTLKQFQTVQIIEIMEYVDTLRAVNPNGDPRHSDYSNIILLVLWS